MPEPLTETGRLLAELEDPSTQPERRLEIGNRLAELGDPRPGVGLTAAGLPDIDWVEVPAGDFLLGRQKARERTGAFRIARYPVTNAQFQAFVSAGGYRDDRWWAGSALRTDRAAAPVWAQANRPYTDVTWYEAVAFCRWLSAALGLAVRLPTELEWEKAARGADGREYPWGEGYRAGFANIDERSSGAGPTRLGQTTAVGLYPQGAAPCGALDLAGNVWDWCLNTFDDPEDADTDGEASRVLRGGSWHCGRTLARADFRVRVNPDERLSYVGFRLSCSAP